MSTDTTLKQYLLQKKISRETANALYEANQSYVSNYQNALAEPQEEVSGDAKCGPLSKPPKAKMRHKEGATKWKRRMEATSTSVPVKRVKPRHMSKTGNPPQKANAGVLTVERRYPHQPDFKIYTSVDTYNACRNARPGPCRDHFCLQEEKQILLDEHSEKFLQEVVYTGEISPDKYNSLEYVRADPSRAFNSLLFHATFSEDEVVAGHAGMIASIGGYPIENGDLPVNLYMAKKKLDKNAVSIVQNYFTLKSQGMEARICPEIPLEERLQKEKDMLHSGEWMSQETRDWRFAFPKPPA